MRERQRSKRTRTEIELYEFRSFPVFPPFTSARIVQYEADILFLSFARSHIRLQETRRNVSARHDKSNRVEQSDSLSRDRSDFDLSRK